MNGTLYHSEFFVDAVENRDFRVAPSKLTRHDWYLVVSKKRIPSKQKKIGSAGTVISSQYASKGKLRAFTPKLNVPW